MKKYIILIVTLLIALALCMLLGWGMSGAAHGSVVYEKPLPVHMYTFLQVKELGSYGNNQIGDCSLAAAADIEQIWEHSQHSLPVTPIINQFYALNGGTLEGIDTPTTLNAWETTGIDGVKISSYTSIAIDQLSIEQAMVKYHQLYAVVNLTVPSNAFFGTGEISMTASLPDNEPEPEAWTPQNTTPGPLVPHAVDVVGYGTKYVYIETWGAVQPVTWAWFIQYDSLLYGVTEAA